MTKDRRGHGATALAGLLPRVAGKALRQRGFVESAVITRWAEIVGQELAEETAPERIRFPRGQRAGGVLHVRVGGAAALELQHHAPVVVERVNAFFGYPAVARLQLVQAPLPPAAERPARVSAEPLDNEAEAALAGAVEGVENDELRGALLRLGRAIRRSRSSR